MWWIRLTLSGDGSEKDSKIDVNMYNGKEVEGIVTRTKLQMITRDNSGEPYRIYVRETPDEVRGMIPSAYGPTNGKTRP